MMRWRSAAMSRDQLLAAKPAVARLRSSLQGAHVLLYPEGNGEVEQQRR